MGYNLESSKFPKNLLKKFKEKYKLAHKSRELNKIYNWNLIEAEKYIENLRPPCHDYANPKCGAKQHPLLTKYPSMPDDYKKELQNCITDRQNTTENNIDIKENNVLLVKHFDEKFPITEEQLQAIKCFHCQTNKQCKEKLAFNLDELRQWHTSNYDNPYTTPIRHLLTSDFPTLLHEYPCNKQLNAICHLTISLILAEISHTFLTDKTSVVAYAYLTNANEQPLFQIDIDNSDDAATKVKNTTEIIIPSRTKLVIDINLCLHSHLLPQIETVLRYPLYTINYQFSLPPIHHVTSIIFNNMEWEEIIIPKHSDIFAIQFPSKYPISLIQTTHKSMTSLYKTLLDTETQHTRSTLSLVTSNLLNTFKYPKEPEDTTLTLTDDDDNTNTHNTSDTVNLTYSVPWNNKLASISQLKLNRENLHNLAKLLYVTHNDNKSFLQDMQNIEFKHIFDKLKMQNSKTYVIKDNLLYKYIDHKYKLMLPNQIALDFFKQCHSNNLHRIPTDLLQYMHSFHYDKYNEIMAKQQCLVCQLTPELRPKAFQGGPRSFDRSIRPNQMLMVDTFHLKTSTTSLLVGVAVDYASLFVQGRILQDTKSTKMLQWILDIYSFTGCNSYILTDGGPENLGSLPKTLALLGCTSLTFTPHMSRQRGTAERTIALLCQHIKKSYLHVRRKANNTMDYRVLLTIALQSLNEQAPQGVTISRRQLYFGLAANIPWSFHTQQDSLEHWTQDYLEQLKGLDTLYHKNLILAQKRANATRQNNLIYKPNQLVLFSEVTKQTDTVLTPHIVSSPRCKDCVRDVD